MRMPRNLDAMQMTPCSLTKQTKSKMYLPIFPQELNFHKCNKYNRW